ncbi:MAG TPA: DUF1054 family protein [Calidithermus sp.]|nr:DUF1054 family protein [Calidithermus sp.]
MPSPTFGAADFQVFELKGFRERMEEIRSRIRPKLEGLGDRLASELKRSTGEPVFPHVARHARRTVNPPEDTWVAFAGDPRGYKKHPHFKLAISRHCLRFLFEVGPEHADKPGWAAAWKKNVPKLGPVLRRLPGVQWFRNEHDEEPAAALADLTQDDLARLGEDLTRTRDGQLVLGRVVPAAEVVKWPEARVRSAALETFRALAPLYRLY